MIIEENWGEQEYEKAREQKLASPTPPPPTTVKEQEEQLLQLPYYSMEPEITLPTVSPSKREQQLVEGVPTKEPTPTEEKEQAPSHYHQPSREEQMVERPHSQQAGMVDNNVNPTLPQSSEVVEKKLCKPDKMGVCRDHGCEIKKFMVSTKKWCDRGKGKGWGWVSKRVTKYACTFEKTARNPTQEGRLRDYCVTEPSDKYDTDGDILL